MPKAEQPLVSVVIPTYGRPDMLERCVNSVLQQTYPRVEIFVVDDNDPDTESRSETEKLMERFASNSRVNYLRHDRNRNGSAARNTGWRASSGKYITFLDDDDAITQNKVEKCVETLESLDDGYGMCYSRYRINKANGSQQQSGETRSGDCYLLALMRTFFLGSGSNLFLKKSVVDEIGGYDESFRRNQDIEFTARALEHYKIAFIDEVLLEIFQEGSRTYRTFETLDEYARHYLSKFASRIDRLNKKDRKRVIAVISLERCRVAFMRKSRRAGLRILRENHVSLLYILRYFRYLAKRYVTGTSVGFDGT